MKKILSSGLAIGTMISLVGCGGGSSSSDTSTVPTGKSYYIDNAVGGVKYTCGTQEGITGADGNFTFEVGSSCTFYLGDLKLRDVAPGLLVDGADVYETDNAIREILLSLDEDGDTSNGITINATIVEALATEGITSLPTNTTEMDALKSVIEANGGTVVSEIDAQAHFLKSLFSGKTFNIVENWEIIQWVFDDTVTEVNVMVNGAVAGRGAVWIDGDKLYRATDHYYMVEDVTAEYALIGNYYQSEPVTYTKFYFDEAKAQAYLASLTTPMTTEMLSGKVFYTDGIDNFELISFISSSEVIFREILIAQDGSISFDTGANVSPYTINASGDVVITFSNGGTNTYKLIDTTDTQWNMVKNGDANSAFSTWLLNAPTNFPASILLETFVSGNTFAFDEGSAVGTDFIFTFGSDGVYSDDAGNGDTCAGTWSVVTDTQISVPTCGVTFDFNGELTEGMTVIVTAQDPGQQADVFTGTITTATETSTVTPPTTNDLVITEAMLSGKTFYEYDYETDQNNVKINDVYGKMTLANGVLTRTEIYVDVNTQQETVDGPFTLDYIIVSGKIKVDLTAFGEGYGRFTLNAESTDAWTLTMEDDADADGVIDAGSARTTTWYLSKPANYPAGL